MTCCIYRAYDDAGLLLYIGSTVDFERRMKEHRSYSAWVRYHHRIDVRQYPSAGRARAVERRALRILAPLYNANGARHDVQSRKTLDARESRIAAILNAADPKVTPIKSTATWGRWLKAGCPGADE